MSDDSNKITIENYSGGDDQIVTYGGAASLAKLFEGNVQNQLSNNQIQAATSAACVTYILTMGRSGGLFVDSGASTLNVKDSQID
ncbi:hypothetical protein [Oceanicaulis sp. MMSF_3324]|uniref:hypothetical protein n=1 Tax=Oceanicaulis sp. MMSF_3324 TaxID=3046702 RepID=UPI0027401969|nr:hypothetical protein [Oceanicaulis sp. MMSF_3324]